MQEPSERTELWTNDPVTGEAMLIEVFQHSLSEDDLRALALAAALTYLDHLTVGDLWSLG